MIDYLEFSKLNVGDWLVIDDKVNTSPILNEYDGFPVEISEKDKDLELIKVRPFGRQITIKNMNYGLHRFSLPTFEEVDFDDLVENDFVQTNIGIVQLTNFFKYSWKQVKDTRGNHFSIPYVEGLVYRKLVRNNSNFEIISPLIKKVRLIHERQKIFTK